MPARLALEIVATPPAFVTAVPTELPFNVNAIVFPLTGEPEALKVADTLLEPAYVPLAAAGDSVVAVGLLVTMKGTVVVTDPVVPHEPLSCAFTVTV
jgi:hypothetical protein